LTEPGTRAFHGWRGCFPLDVDFCAPAKGNEKGSVERGNEYVRGLFFRPMPQAASWDELNERLMAELERDLDHRKLPDGRTARQALIAECHGRRNAPRSRPALVRSCPRVSIPMGRQNRTRPDNGGLGQSGGHNERPRSAGFPS